VFRRLLRSAAAVLGLEERLALFSLPEWRAHVGTRRAARGSLLWVGRQGLGLLLDDADRSGDATVHVVLLRGSVSEAPFKASFLVPIDADVIELLGEPSAEMVRVLREFMGELAGLGDVET
jgi:hypothetical protein